jgi:biotin carboxylase
MRERWEEAGIPQPKFCSLIEKSDVEHLQALKLPFIIKLAYGAGSIGQQIVNSFDEIDGAIECLIDATNQARKAGKHEFSEKTGFPLLIAEEIIESSTNSWYEQPGYGDYLSVEGLVKDGVYYPLAMTGRLPTIPPFTELCNLAPCVLDNEKKRQIIQWISRSIDALGFENCATHTEIKLMANGNISFLETAARMGGVAIAVELEEVFAIDYVDLFLSVILGEECEIPAFEMNEPRCAAASVALIGCDSNGTPWNCSRVFDPEAVDWNALLGGQCSVKIQYAQSIPVGADFPLYNNAGGVLNYAGQAFLTSDDPISLQKAAYNLLNNLEQFMPQKVEVVG